MTVPKKPVTALNTMRGPGCASGIVTHVTNVTMMRKQKYHQRTVRRRALGKKWYTMSVFTRLTASAVESHVSDRKAADTTRNTAAPTSPQRAEKNFACTTAISHPSGTVPVGASNANASRHVI